jgi:1-acyl-sn-glycerol-3-phosphate acyltransferase
MPKQILGDDPFDDEPGTGPGDETEAGEAEADADVVEAELVAETAGAGEGEGASEGEGERASEGEGEGESNGEGEGESNGEGEGERNGEGERDLDEDWDAGVALPRAHEVSAAAEVPDASPPGNGLPDDDDYPDPDDSDDMYLGGEAAVPPGEYGPPITSHFPEKGTITSEIRELERRVRASLTPAFPIEQRRRLPLEFWWKRYRHLAMRHRSDVVDEFGRDPAYSARMEPWVEFLYSRYFRVQTEGIAHVPDSGRALLVCNHSGTLPYDGIMLMHAVRKEHPARRDVRPLVEDFVFHFPYLGTVINRIGGVRACQENARRLLDADKLVAVFPEGVKGMGKLYKQRYQLQRFGRGGFVKLALRARTPIVPVAIVGAEEAHPMLARVSWLAKTVGVPYVPVTPTFPWLGPLGLVPLPSRWRLQFGEPIDLAADYGPEAADDRILVNKLAEDVRSRIQEMIDAALGERKSVLFG